MEIIKFNKNKSFFKEAAQTGIAFTSGANPNFLKGIAQNLSVSTIQLPLIVAKGEVVIEGEKNLQFKGNDISISGNAASGMRFAIFQSLQEVEKDLEKNDKIKVSLSGENDIDSVYSVLSFSYEIGASGSAKWILGATQFNFGGSGEKAKRMVVIKASQKDTKIKTIIQNTIDLIKPVNGVKSIEDILPGTYTIVETDGQITSQFGAQFGYDINWVRTAKVGGVEGDIGLKANTGASIGIGVNQAGKYALTLARPSAKKVVRVKLQKQRKKGWNFALDLGVEVQGQLDKVFMETSFDEFTQSLLGTHYAQIMNDLKKIDRITDPDKLGGELAGTSLDLLRKLTGSKIDDVFGAVKNKLVTFLEKWDELGQKADKVGATLWGKLDKITPGELDKIQQQIVLIANGKKEDVAKFVVDLQSDVNLENSKIGSLVSDLLVNDDLISTISDAKLFKKFQDAAKALVKVLEAKDVLINLHQTISTKLNLDQIKKVTTEVDSENLDDWLKARLESLFEKGVDELGATGFFLKVTEVKQLITNIYNKRAEFFEKTKRALTKKYALSLAYNHQKISEKNALIDFELDFTKNPQLGGILVKALDGHYEKILANPVKGLRLNLGTLSNSITRKSELEINIPFLTRNISHLNKVVTKGQFLDEDDGRLLMYDLEAEDTRIRRNRRISRLTVGAIYKVKNNEVTNHLSQELSLSYSFKLAKKRLRTRELEQIVEPFIAKYLKDALIGSDSTKNRKNSIDDWIMDMDQFIDEKEKNGTNNFGRTLLTQEIKVPISVAEAWFSAPQTLNDAGYERVSVAIQRKMREIVPFYFLSDETIFTNFNKREEVYAALLYESLPAIGGLDVNKKGKLRNHWQYMPYGNRMKHYVTSDTQLKLGKRLGYVFALLTFSNDPKLKKTAQFFQPSIENIKNIIQQAGEGSRTDNFILSLFNAENEIIKRSIEAGLDLAGFKAQSGGNPVEAMKSLEDFGEKVTRAFNDFTPAIARKKDYTRYLGPLLFIAAAQGLKPGLQAEIQGSLELIVVRKEADFQLGQYLENELPDTSDVILSQRIFDFD